nr:MAG TPA: large terminase protein [Caudoviricetes sp.]
MTQISTRSSIWTSAKIEAIVKEYNLTGSLPAPRNHPFYDNNIRKMKDDVLFEYTQEEILELAKCKEDIIYFAENFCKVLTDGGNRLVKLRKYQRRILLQLKKYNKNILLQSRQSGKSVTTAIFVVWYLIFHKDRNVVIASATSDKAEDLAQKIEVMLLELPYFLKLGLKKDNIRKKHFSNNNTLTVETTTENTAAGMTCHLLIMDEFALVHHSIINKLYRTIIPTMSSSVTAKLIIMSTPRGTNKFYEVWQKAVKGTNNFNPIRVDWWEVPLNNEIGDPLLDENGNIVYRGEEWKQAQIEDLGNEEDFNQEYGNQFMAGNSMIFNSVTMRTLKTQEKKYKPFPVDAIETILEDLDTTLQNSDVFIVHPDIDPSDFSDDTSKFIFSVDLAGGGGGDYSVITFYKIMPMSKTQLDKIKIATSVKDFYKLVEVAKFRSNELEVDMVAKIFYHIVMDLFNENIVGIVELNYEGRTFTKTCSEVYGDNNDLDTDIFLEFPYNMVWEDAKTFKQGVFNTDSVKKDATKKFKKHVRIGQLLLTDSNTITQSTNFSLNKSGNYECQSGNDDDIMCAVNVTHVLYHPLYEEMVEDLYDDAPSDFKQIVDSKLSSDI